MKEVQTMAYKNNAKLGFVGFTYPAPKGLSRFEATKWLMEETHKMGCELMGLFTMGMQPNEIEELEALYKQYGFDGSEGFMPRFIFELAGFQGADPVKAKESFEAHLESSKAQGKKILRSGYNTFLKLKYSRWNLDRGWTGEEQLENLQKCFEIAYPLLAKYDLSFAMENHLDFAAHEVTEVFESIPGNVEKKRIGFAYDTANTLFNNLDPAEDLEYMPQWALTTHIKDSKIAPNPFNGPDGPLTPVGCALGEGNCNVKKALDLILEKSPNRDGIHLILETGWFGKAVHDVEPDMDEYNRMILRKSLAWLKDYLTV